MKSLLLFLSLSCLGAAADKAPPPPLCHLEFNSFSLGVNGTTKEPYCILSLKGRPLEHLSVVSISKERPFDLSVTDSTGKTYALNHVLIEPAWEKEWNREKEFHLRFSLSEWPAEHAEWLRIRGNVSVVCIKASSLDPVEVDLIHPGETEIPVVGNDIPQSDIADPARTETLILFVEKWEGKEEEGFQWKFSLGHRDSFPYCGMELEDMQGRPIPFKRFTGGMCSGGGGTTCSEFFILTRPYERLKVRILHADPRNIEIRQVPVDISVGMGGPLNKEKVPAAK
ncbi:hypothetical protein [uncultured Akkermansia sp.]|uniref:hypothetical protein n=1 Tax=Akkermansia sp. TaxID=1872421 RepID=UPI0025CD07EA|nr:hypothetical protein [uncultured Akkermansia sp.]